MNKPLAEQIQWIISTTNMALERNLPVPDIDDITEQMARMDIDVECDTLGISKIVMRRKP